jgi:MFS family permease
MPGRGSLPRAVWVLGWVSLATDAASEAIYPLLPFFLTHVLGAGVLTLGVVEGAADAASSLLKILSGAVADRWRVKRPLVLAGYALSSTVRPLIALARIWPHVFVVRFLDRVGKGIRSAPRDALLAGWATHSNRGRVFSFHRGMDHAGAVVGPLLATLFLWVYPGQYRALFAATIVPGVVSVMLIFFLIREPADAAPASRADGVGIRVADVRRGLKGARGRFMLVLSVFTLGNSTDAYLLLKLSQALGDIAIVPIVWSALHIVKASVSFAAGSWSDRYGRRLVIGLGWLVYAVVYLGFATSTSSTSLILWFLLYGCYFGLAEGAEKALIADLAPSSDRGVAFGIYAAIQGLGALAASLLFGTIWIAFGPAAAFTTGAVLATVAVCGLFAVDGRV